MVSSRDRSSEVRPPIKSSFPFGNSFLPFYSTSTFRRIHFEHDHPPWWLHNRRQPLLLYIYIRFLHIFFAHLRFPLYTWRCILFVIEEIGTKFEPGNYQSSFPSLPPLTFSSVILRSRILCTISSTFLRLLESGMTLGNQWDSAREFSTDNEGKMEKGVGWWNNVWLAANETIGFL